MDLIESTKLFRIYFKYNLKYSNAFDSKSQKKTYNNLKWWNSSVFFSFWTVYKASSDTNKCEWQENRQTIFSAAEEKPRIWNSIWPSGRWRCAKRFIAFYLHAWCSLVFSLLCGWHQHAIMKIVHTHFPLPLPTKKNVCSQSISALSADCGIDGTNRCMLTHIDHLGALGEIGD